MQSEGKVRLAFSVSCLDFVYMDDSTQIQKFGKLEKIHLILKSLG